MAIKIIKLMSIYLFTPLHLNCLFIEIIFLFKISTKFWQFYSFKILCKYRISQKTHKVLELTPHRWTLFTKASAISFTYRNQRRIQCANQPGINLLTLAPLYYITYLLLHLLFILQIQLQRLFKIIYRCSHRNNFPLVSFCISEIRCGHPAVPVNARVSLSSTTLTRGTIATYVCDEGYETFGETQISCSTNGQWIGELPFCGKKITDLFLNICVLLLLDYLRKFA